MKRKLPPEEKKRLGAAALTLDELISRQTIRSERDLQNQIADYLRLRDIPFYRQRMDKRTTGKVGTPDFICCVAGYFVAFECKRPGGKLIEEQARQIQAIRDANGQAVEVTTLEQVKRILDNIEGLFASAVTCKHGIRDLATNLPYCRRCDVGD